MHPGLLVLGGFLLGTAGVKAVRSRVAHNAYVRGIVCALQCKDYVSRVVDEAKAECEDILAEAEFIKDEEAAEKNAEEVIVERTEVVVTENQPAKRRTAAAKKPATKRKPKA